MLALSNRLFVYSVWITQAISDVKPEAVTLSLCRPMYKTLLCERAEVSVLRPWVLLAKISAVSRKLVQPKRTIKQNVLRGKMSISTSG